MEHFQENGLQKIKVKEEHSLIQKEILKKHQMEIIGKNLRENMIWGKDTNLDNASN